MKPLHLKVMRALQVCAGLLLLTMLLPGIEVSASPMPNTAPELADTTIYLDSRPEDNFTMLRPRRTHAPVIDGYYTDADADVCGVAVCGMTGDGRWYYSAGGQWALMDSCSTTHALLLNNEHFTFVPNPDYCGTATLLLRAWDKTTGTAYSFTDVTVNGGNTAFSANTAVGYYIVSPSNDAPSISMPNTTGILDFDGTSAYVDLPDFDSIGSNLTFEAWVNMDDPNKAWNRIIEFGNGSNSDNVFFGFIGTTGKLTAEVYNGTSSIGTVSAPSAIPTGQWVHVAAVFSANTVTIYQNGSPVASGSTSAINSVTRTVNYLGRSNWAVDQYFDGKMTDVRVWTTARSQTEIANNKNKILQGNEPGLALYYKASEAGTTELYDYGPMASHGTFHGTAWQSLQAPVASVYTNKNTAKAIDGISLYDVDGDTFNVAVTYTVSHGTLTANTTGSVTGSGTNTLQVTGTIAQLNSELASIGLIYTPAFNFIGTDKLSVHLSDLGNVGGAIPLTDIDSIYLNVTPKSNTAPVMVNTTVTVDEDNSFLLVNELGGMFTDVDNDDPTMVRFERLPAYGILYRDNGSLVEKDTAYSLAEFTLMTYTPDADYIGSDSFTVNGFDGTLWAAIAGEVAITVMPVNDLPVLTDIIAQVDEDATIFIADFSSPTTFTDVDGDSPAALKIESLPANGTLSISGATLSVGDVRPASEIGLLVYSPAADYNGADSFTFNVSDGNAYAATAGTVDITVLPVNDVPTGVALSTASIDENSNVGAVVSTFTTTDVDAGDSHVYQMVGGAGDTGNGYFSISGDQLLVANAINYERNTQLSIRVQVIDAAGAALEQVLIIDINDVNDAPIGISLTNNTVAEQQSIGSFVGSLSTTDEDANDSHTYTLVNGAGDSGNSSFAIVNNVLTTATTFDYNTQQQYNIRVRSTDSGLAYTEEVILINITDANQAPAAISIGHSAIMENNAIGDLIGILAATDPDANDTHTFTLVSGAGDEGNASFTITNGELRAAAIFDYETQDTYSIRVQATDASGATMESNLTINITDGIDAPTAITISAASIDENSPIGTIIGFFSTTDEDQTSGHTYSFATGAGDSGNGLFMLSNGSLLTASPMDFESASSHSVRIRVTDDDGAWTESAFTIAVNDINEAPTGISINIIGIDENSPIGTAVGNISATDVDVNDLHTFTLVQGGGATDNSKFAIVANKLQVNALIDYETQASYTVRIRATDNGGEWFEKAFTIAINDINEAPTGLTLSATTINENEPAGSAIGNFAIVDQDQGDSHGFTLVAGHGDSGNGMFYIGGNTLYANATFNFEQQPSYSIRVAGTDVGGLKEEVVYTITIGNVADAPVVNSAGLFRTVYKDQVTRLNGREFSYAYSQEEGNTQKLIRIDVLPANGQLLYSGTPITTGQTILVAEFNDLSYQPNSGYLGVDVFAFSAFDGVLYSASADYVLNVVSPRITSSINGVLTNSSIIRLAPTSLAGQSQAREGDAATTIESMPLEVVSFGNYPNPFQNGTTISFELSEPMEVTLEVYDLLGRKVASLMNGDLVSGEQLVQWNGSEAGQYIARLTAIANDGTVLTETLSLIKTR